MKSVIDIVWYYSNKIPNILHYANNIHKYNYPFYYNADRIESIYQAINNIIIQKITASTHSKNDMQTYEPRRKNAFDFKYKY